MTRTEAEEHHVLQLLTDISQTVLDVSNLKDSLQEMTARVTDTLGAHKGSIAVSDQNGEYLRFLALHDHDPETIRALNHTMKLPVGEGVAGTAYEKRETLAVSDIYEDRLFKEEYLPYAEREGFRSVMSVPMVLGEGECPGVISLYYRNRQSFDRRVRQALEIVANHVAIAFRQRSLMDHLKYANRKLKRRARTDGLTGLPNRETIEEHLSDEVENADRYDRWTSVVMVDIDHFKVINDRYGHPFGDKVLKELASIFREESRAGDRVGRYGGEEFLFVLSENELDEAAEAAERIRKAVQDHIVDTGRKSTSPTISCGVASRPPGSDMPEEDLIEEADQALLNAKERGRNQTATSGENGCYFHISQPVNSETNG